MAPKKRVKSLLGYLQAKAKRKGFQQAQGLKALFWSWLYLPLAIEEF
jgi:hypothetical protein